MGNHTEAVFEKAALSKIRFKKETTVKLKELFSLQYFGWLEILATTWLSHSSGGCYVRTRVVMLALMWAQRTNARRLTGQLPLYVLSFTSRCPVPPHMLPICAAIPLTTNRCSTAYCCVVSVAHSEGVLLVFRPGSWCHLQHGFLSGQDPRTPAFVLQTVFKAELL